MTESQSLVERLAGEAGCEPIRKDAADWIVKREDLAKFARLVVNECARISVECGDDVVEVNGLGKTEPLSEDWMRGAFGMSRLVAEEVRQRFGVGR